MTLRAANMLAVCFPFRLASCGNKNYKYLNLDNGKKRNASVLFDAQQSLRC